MRFTFGIILLVLINHVNLLGQVSDYGSTTETHYIVSKEDKKYKIKVTLPHNYNQNKTYETVYYLDSWWLSEMVLGTYAILNLSEKIDPIILIGISIDGNLKDWNIQRTLDFTPSKYDLGIMGFEMQAGSDENSIRLNPNNTGAAAIFSTFLETKVITSIEEKYPNLEKNRGLIGHSYGGLFSFYIMQQKPQLFSDFIIISPSLWWNKSELVKKEFFLKFKENKLASSIYLSYGSSESKLITRSNTEMDTVLKGLEKDQLNYKFNIYQKANHNSILSQGIYDGLLYTYEK